MIARLPRIQRQVLATSLLLLAFFLVVRVVVVPIWNRYLENRAAIAQYEENIARYSRLSSQLTALQSAVKDLSKSDDLAPYVLPEESEPLAAAALQERVKSAVTSSGGTLTSTQVLTAVPEGGLKRVIINVRMAVSTEALQRVLYELESNLPYLMTDEIIILSRGGQRRRQLPVAVDLLDVRFNLSGYMRDTGKPA